MFDSSGRQLWFAREQTSTSEDIGDACMDKKGNIYVAGTAQPDSTLSWRPLVVKYNASGDLLWRKVIELGVGSEAQMIALDRSGATYVGGEMDGTAQKRGFVVKLVAGR